MSKRKMCEHCKGYHGYGVAAGFCKRPRKIKTCPKNTNLGCEIITPKPTPHEVNLVLEDGVCYGGSVKSARAYLNTLKDVKEGE
jgi:hypothetical protein